MFRRMTENRWMITQCGPDSHPRRIHRLLQLSYKLKYCAHFLKCTFNLTPIIMSLKQLPNSEANINNLMQLFAGKIVTLHSIFHLPSQIWNYLRSIGLWRWHINITITNLDIVHRPVFYLKLNSTQLNSIGLSVTHRKHITSLLRAQQVNAIYRFVTIVY
jgi:hypothetical protein